MKLLVTLILGCALFSKAYPLMCHECVGEGQCVQAQCQASQTKCASSTEEVSQAAQSIQKKVKSCVQPSQCHSGSVNIGITRVTVNTQCCETDLCNSQQVPALSDSTPNGKKCFTCVGDDCTRALECLGPEDRCIKASVSTGGQTVTLMGCASRTACSGSSMIQFGTTISEISCCEGKMCNNALRIGQSILFLFLVPLASFILFN